MMLKNKVLKFFNDFNIYIVNSTWGLTERVFSLGVSFLITILVARYLGPAQFGLFSYATALFALFSILGGVGVGVLVERDLSKHPNFKQEIMGTSFRLMGFGFLLGLILLWGFLLLSENIQSEVFWLLLILSISYFFYPFYIINHWFASRSEFKYPSLALMIAIFISSIIKIALVIGGAHLILFAYANVIQVILTAIILIFFYKYKSKLNLFAWRFSYTRAKELLSQSWMIYLGSFFAVIYLRVDQVMLKWLVGVEEVGIYVVAATLSQALYFLPSAIVNSFFPKLIKLKENNPTHFNKRLQQIFDLLFVMAFGVAIVTTLVAEPLITMLFGQVYQDAGHILTIHIWVALFIFMNALFAKWIVIENVLIFFMLMHAVGALFNVALNYWLIPHYGAVGAAYATLLSYATSSYLLLLLYSKTRPIFWMMTKSIFSPIRYSIYILREKL